MKLVILDSGLRGTNGHHYNLDRSLKKIAEKNALECIIYSNQDCQKEIVEDLQCYPHFRYECYFQFKTFALDGKIKDFVILNEQIFQELKNLPHHLLTSENVFLFHTVTERHLEGILHWLDTLPQESAPQVIVFLMLPSGVKYRHGKLSVYDCLTASLYHYAFNRVLKQQAKITFYGSGDAHSGDYSWLLGEEISSHPMFLGSVESDGDYISLITLPEEKNIVLYLGDAKASKGFHHLPEIYQICQRKLPEYNFIVHVNGPEIKYPPLDSVAKTLFKIAEKNPNLIILDGFLDTVKYYHCLQSADLIVIPYDPIAYGDKSSGILWESLYYGKSVVVPKNSWLEYEAQKENHVFTAFAEFEAESIAHAIIKAVENLAENRDLARARSQEYRQRQGIEAVWNLLTSPQPKEAKPLYLAEELGVTQARFFQDNQDVTPFPRVVNHSEQRRLATDYNRGAIAFSLDALISLSLPSTPPQATQLYLEGKSTEKIREYFHNNPLPQVCLNGWLLQGKFELGENTWQYHTHLNLPQGFLGKAAEITVDFAPKNPELILISFPGSGADILVQGLGNNDSIHTGSILPWWSLDGENLAALYKPNDSFIEEDWQYIKQRTIAFARAQFYQTVEPKQNWIEIYSDYQIDLSLILKLFPTAKIACLFADGRTIISNLNQNPNTDWKKHFFAHYNEQPNPTNLLQSWCQWHSRLIADAQQLGVEIHYLNWENLIKYPKAALEKLYHFFDLPLTEIKSTTLDFFSKQEYLIKNNHKTWENSDQELESLLTKLGIINDISQPARFHWQTFGSGQYKESDKLNIYLLRTLYSHFSENTGPQHFIKYLDYNRLNIIEYAMPFGSHFAEAQLSLKGKNNLENLIKEQGVNSYSLNNLMAEIKVFEDLVQNKFNIDLIHYLDGEHGMQYLPVLLEKYQGKRKQSKIIVTYHQPPQFLKDLIDQEIVKKVDAVHVLASNQYDYFSEFIPQEKLFLIPHGVSEDFFIPRNYPLRKDAKIHCLTVGTWQRNYDTVYQVAQSLLDSPFTFHIVSQKERKNFAQQPANVTVYSGLADEELLTLYQRCDLLFLPLQDATANNAILEALGCGLPIVASDIPALRNYVPKEASYLIKDNNIEGFKQAILSLAENGDLRREMGRAARKTAEQLAWAKIAKKMETLYEQVISCSDKDLS